MCNSQVEKRSHEFEIKEDPVFYGKRQHQQHQTGRYGTEQQQLYMCVPQSAALKKTKKSHIERKELQYSSRKRDICVLDAVCYLVIPPFKLWQKEEAPLVLCFQQNPLFFRQKAAYSHTQ